MSNRTGLRERNKQETRLAISDIATRLFIERGFDNVTVAEIAEAANVAKMTVFNYFSRKEDLFFDREDESRSLVREALVRRAQGRSPIAALGGLAPDLVAQNHPFAKFTAGTAQFWHTVKQSNTLAARARELRDIFANDLAEMLADSSGRPRSDPEAHLIAAMVVAAWQTAYAEGLRQQRIGAPSHAVQAAFLALLDRSFRGVAAGMKGTPYA